MYGAGVLLAPPERVRLVIDDTVAATGRLRADLEELLRRVHEHRLPAAAVERLDEIASMLRGLLDRAGLPSASPDALYEVSRAIRTDLPISFEAYLNLPRWYASRRAVQGSAADELLTQLALIADSVARTAGEAYAVDIQRMRDHPALPARPRAGRRPDLASSGAAPGRGRTRATGA